MEIERPDLSQAAPEIKAYIEALETELARQLAKPSARAASTEPSEPPTTQNVLIVSRYGMAKRTPRHHYDRQRRSGMGILDLETAAGDYPAHLAIADEADRLLLFTNLGRVFPLQVADLAETPVRAEGQSLVSKFPFHANERVAGLLTADGGEYVILVSERGWVERVRRSYFGKSLIPGMTFHDPKQGGQVTAVCWTRGDEQLFLATRSGQGTRFLETQVPSRGCLGLRVDEGDTMVAVTAVNEDSGVFVISHDGKGTIRLMSGFRMNKAPGAGGKNILKTDRLVGAVTVTEKDDIFTVSESGKIIRFRAGEVPPKEGVVQGVNCMGLRHDTVTAVAVATLES